MKRRVYVCVGSMHSQMVEWILTKFCRLDLWVPTMVFNQYFFNVTPGGGKRSLKFH